MTILHALVCEIQECDSAEDDVREVSESGDPGAARLVLCAVHRAYFPEYHEPLRSRR